MSAITTDCPPFDACGPCGTLPGAFVRLRYFYGKRMGVADFVDEQRYHAGKQRFHNQRLHGAGLLCGLAVTREDDAEVLLRVGKGAALDACGREIVVGYDQCIDLDAWLRRELDERRAIDATWPASALDGDGNLPVVVALRYRDCAASPEPAPRDPCACDAAGCDFGRVREEFELAILPANDPAATTTRAATIGDDALARAVGRALGGATLARRLADAAAAACPEPAADGWLVLASFTAILTTTAGELHVTDLGPIRGEATLLAQTALLQDLVRRLVAAHLEAGALVDGPEVIALTVTAEPAPSTFYRIDLDLSGPVIAETVPTGAFTLTRLAPSGAPTPGWTAIPCETTYVAPTGSTPPRLRIRVDNAGGALVDDGLYRLAIDPAEVPPATPIVDDELRPLRPLRGVFQFALDDTGAGLVRVEPPYAR